MVISALADGILRSVEDISDAVTSPFSEPVIRLGVTGLSRAGKTVFITSLVSNLLDRGRMPQLLAAASGSILTALLQPQPDDTVARFPYEDHLARLTSQSPVWPDGTRRASELRLSLKVQPNGILSGLSGPRVVHLDIVDYPGEWLLDLTLLDQSFEQWSRQTLDRMEGRPGGAAYRAALEKIDGRGRIDEVQGRKLAEEFTTELEAARDAGFSDLTPGRFLLPGDLEGSPALTFAPLPAGLPQGRGGLYAEFARRFEAYKRQVVKPFFRDHFSRIDRQVVLLDVLGAIHSGPRAVEDLRRTMAGILSAFRPGRNSWLSRLLGGRRVERILFAATKADHLHHEQHPRLTAITEALLRDAKDRAKFAGALTEALTIASLRTTTEDRMKHDGTPLGVVRGLLMETGKEAAFFPGQLPEDPSKILLPARDGADSWLGDDYGIMNFAPVPLTRRPNEGLPHVRLDKAAQFLFGDRL